MATTDREQGERSTGWARVEVFLAGFLLVSPAVMWGFDSGLDDDPRASISAYHDMKEAPAFYVPLTVVAMLYFVNGWLKQGHWYNIGLGLALAGLIILDHDGSTSGWHGAFTILFFAGNVVAAVVFSEIAWSWLKPLIVLGIAVVLVLWWQDQVSTFVAEWLAMTLIAVHFVLDQLPTDKYRALRSNERPPLPFGLGASRASAS